MCSKDFKQIFIAFVKKSLEYNSALYKLKQILAKRTTDFFETDCCGLNSSVYSFVSIDLLVCLCVCLLYFFSSFLSFYLSFICLFNHLFVILFDSPQTAVRKAWFFF